MRVTDPAEDATSIFVCNTFSPETAVLMVTMKVTTACASLHNEAHAETGLYRGQDCSVHTLGAD